MAKFVKAEGKLWVVMGENDFEPAPQLDVFTSEKAARDYIRYNVEDVLNGNDEKTDQEGRTAKECAEEGVADLGYLRIMLLEADKVKQENEIVW